MNWKAVGRNLLALLAGIVAGSMLNLLLVNIGPSVIALPEGADNSTMEGLRESMKLFRPVHFLFPFLAHALGTMLGAFVAARLAVSWKRVIALAIGVFFLIGGVAAVNMLGGPLWFKSADLLLAYIPTSYIGATLAAKAQGRSA